MCLEVDDVKRMYATIIGATTVEIGSMLCSNFNM